MRDYGQFGDPSKPQTALLVASGQHWEAAGVEVARNCCAGFPLLCDNLDVGDIPAG